MIKYEYYICKEEEHNKFYAFETDDTTHTVTTRWGRLGAKGQSATEHFGDKWDAQRYVNKKLQEKTRKGYRVCSKPDFDKANLAAAIVGTQNKVGDMNWIEVYINPEQINGNLTEISYRKITEDRLSQPDCNPGLLVKIDTKKEYAGETEFTMIFAGEKVYKSISNGNVVSRSTGQPFFKPIEKTDAVYKLVEKIGEVLGRVYG